MLRRTLRLAFLVFSLLPGPRAHAQVRGPAGPPCGALMNKDFLLGDNARYFTNPDLAALRDSLGIGRLPEDFPRSVVKDPGVCGRVFGKVTSVLARAGELARYEKAGYRFAVFRYGPYYAVLLVQGPARDPSDTTFRAFSTGYGDLFILRASDLGLVGRIAA